MQKPNVLKLVLTFSKYGIASKICFYDEDRAYRLAANLERIGYEINMQIEVD